MESVIGILITVFASAGFWSFITIVYQNKKRNTDAEHEALMSLLHHSFYKECKEAIKQGYANEKQVDNVERLYKAYKGLGGNGTGAKLYEEYKKLEVRV